MDRNGVCAKDKLGNRKHEFVVKEDGQGRKIKACEKCGAAILNEIVPRVVHE